VTPTARRKRIDLPTGRVLFGLWPQSMPTHGEGPYIAALARRVDGACEVTLLVGRADVANTTTVFEVEPSQSWRHGARQVLGYAAQTGLSPALALFGPPPGGERDFLRVYVFVRDRLRMPLWLWQYGYWVQASRRTASLKWRPGVAPVKR
jgi:hypothetical protein